MSAAHLRTNSAFVLSPFTAVTKKTLSDAHNENRLVRHGNTSFNQMLKRFADRGALIELIEPAEKKGGSNG